LIKCYEYDLIISDPNGIVYIKTDQLDGETDLKPRAEIDMFRDMDIEEMRNYEIIFNTTKNKLDEFEGKIREIQDISDSESQQNLLISERKGKNLDEGLTKNDKVNVQILWLEHL
jgi:hypothetical protein